MSRDLGRWALENGAQLETVARIVRLPENGGLWACLWADGSFFLVGQFSFIHTCRDKGFPLSAAHGTVAPNKGCVARNWPTVLKEVSLCGSGPLFLLSKGLAHCLLGLGLMSGARCHRATPFWIIDSSSHNPGQRLHSTKGRSIHFSWFFNLSATPQSEGIWDCEVGRRLSCRQG